MIENQKLKYNATLEELEVISEATKNLLLLVQIFPNIKDKTLATDTADIVRKIAGILSFAVDSKTKQGGYEKNDIKK